MGFQPFEVIPHVLIRIHFAKTGLLQVRDLFLSFTVCFHKDCQCGSATSVHLNHFISISVWFYCNFIYITKWKLNTQWLNECSLTKIEMVCWIEAAELHWQSLWKQTVKPKSGSRTCKIPVVVKWILIKPCRITSNGWKPTSEMGPFTHF